MICSCEQDNEKLVQYARLVSLAGIVSVCTAATLIVIRIIALLLTDSSAILASLTDSVMDICSSTFNLIAIKYAMMPADKDHHYGHWKAEALSGIGQCAFISGSALFLVFHGIMRIMHPQKIENIDVGMVVTVIAMIMTIGVVILQTYVARKTNSVAIKADRLHYASDILLNTGVLVSLFLSHFGVIQADGIFAVLLGFYIFGSAIGIFRGAIRILLDAELPQEDIAKIETTILEVPGVSGLHDLRTRQSGPCQFIQAHLEIDKDLTLERAHEVADAAENAVHEIFPEADITLHMEPVMKH